MNEVKPIADGTVTIAGMGEEMNGQWLWKPVLMGMIILALPGCLFSAYLMAIRTCPGMEWACVPTSRTGF